MERGVLGFRIIVLSSSCLIIFFSAIQFYIFTNFFILYLIFDPCPHDSGLTLPQLLNLFPLHCPPIATQANLSGIASISLLILTITQFLLVI